MREISSVKIYKLTFQEHKNLTREIILYKNIRINIFKKYQLFKTLCWSLLLLFLLLFTYLFKQKLLAKTNKMPAKHQRYQATIRRKWDKANWSIMILKRLALKNHGSDQNVYHLSQQLVYCICFYLNSNDKQVLLF